MGCKTTPRTFSTEAKDRVHRHPLSISGCPRDRSNQFRQSQSRSADGRCRRGHAGHRPRCPVFATWRWFRTKRASSARIEAGVDSVAVFASASETFSQRNINCSIAESLERFGPVFERARSERSLGARIHLDGVCMSFRRRDRPSGHGRTCSDGSWRWAAMKSAWRTPSARPSSRPDGGGAGRHLAARASRSAGASYARHLWRRCRQYRRRVRAREFASSTRPQVVWVAVHLLQALLETWPPSA